MTSFFKSDLSKHIGFEYHFVLLSLAWWGMQANLYSTFRKLDSLTRFVPLFTRPKPKIRFLGLFLLRNHTETLATQAMIKSIWLIFLNHHLPKSNTKSRSLRGSSVIFLKVHLINLDTFQQKNTGFFQNEFFHGNALMREYSH